MKSLVTYLRERGLIYDASHLDELDSYIEKQPLTLYCGFDPTASSLHVGSMLPLIMLRRFQEKGHTPIVLIGSATGMIGDPSFRSEERILLTKEMVEHNAKGIEKQIDLFLSASGPNAYKLVKNHEWFEPISFVDFLRDVGKYFSINAMISKESVKDRLENREQGISFTEFSYMLLQAYDFYHLHKNHKCALQIGGSDQWGNITAGIDLIRRKTPGQDSQVFGLTFPLLMMSSGQKFGKTAKGAVWLDRNQTSPYQFYQFWLNTPDSDAIMIMKYFTDPSDDELKFFENQVATKPEERAAQRYIARVLTALVHGEQDTKQAESASQVLFGGNIQGLDSNTLIDIFNEVPSTSLNLSQISPELPLVDLLTQTGLAQSKGAARRLIEGGGIYVNSERISNVAETIGSSRFVDGKVLVLRSGKRTYHLVLLD